MKIYLGFSTDAFGRKGDAMSSFWGCIFFSMGCWLMASGAYRLSLRLGGTAAMLGLLDLYYFVCFNAVLINVYFRSSGI